MFVETEKKNVTLKRIKDDIPYLLKKVGKPAVIVGVFFCPSGSPHVRQQILPSFNDLNDNSANNIHFYLPGWRHVEEFDPLVSHHVFQDANCPLLKYDSNLMYKFKKSLKGETYGWRPTNTLELILMTGTVDQQNKGQLNYGCVMNIQLGTIMNKLDIHDINELFSVIFDFAEEYDGQEPTKALSNKLALKRGTETFLIQLAKCDLSVIMDVITSIRPFAIHDYNRR